MSDHDTREARATLARQRFAPGARVRVLPSYRGSGRFAADGHEGLYTVLGELPTACGAPDYYLAHGWCSDPHAWDLLCHPSRLVPA